MADIKRSSMGRPPVATPRVQQNQNTNASMLSMESSLAKAVGAKLRVELSIPTRFNLEGYLQSISTDKKFLSISASPTLGGPIYMISVQHIQSCNFLELPAADAASTIKPIQPLSAEQAAKRVAAAVAKTKEDEANRGKDVSMEAQTIFDALRKILPTRWEGKGIRVNENVLIEPPYRVENVGGSNEKSVAYVKKALESELRKLAGRAAGITPTASPGPGQRKGG